MVRVLCFFIERKNDKMYSLGLTQVSENTLIIKQISQISKTTLSS